MILGVIPARLNSTRFPSKVIFSLKGKPIIEHVYDKALQYNNIAIKLLISDFSHRSIDVKEDLKNYEN